MITKKNDRLHDGIWLVVVVVIALCTVLLFV
jgi:hypothetical protein